MTRLRDFEVGCDRLKFMPLGITYEGLTFNQKGHDTVIAFKNNNLVRINSTMALVTNDLQPNSFEFGDASLIDQLQSPLET